MSFSIPVSLGRGLAAAGLTALALCLACGSGNPGILPAGGNGGGGGGTTGTGTVALSLCDASTEDWATIGVKLLSVALIPQGQGAAGAVTVYEAPSPAPVINLVQLDQLSEILGNVTVPAGTYTGAVLTISGNSGDVSLVSAADPSAGFPDAPATQIASDHIQIQGATGTAGNRTVAVKVNLVSYLVVTAAQSNALDLEFDLAHPAFIVDHEPAGGGSPYWAVNFNGPIRHNPGIIKNLLLRHLYATVNTVSTDDTAITVFKDYPAWPVSNPETGQTTTQSLTVLADASNGTLYYDLDTPANNGTIMNFSALASTLPGRYVRIAARYQQDGTLVATRIWASKSFNSVYLSPEGHVLHVDTVKDIITVQNEMGVGVPVTVTADTQFFFRTPAKDQSSAGVTPINASGSGITFLTDKNLVRGFKVHTNVDSTFTAQTVDIETAKYDGTASAPTTGSTPGFTYTRTFHTAGDDYTQVLPYISAGTANGSMPGGAYAGTTILGFKWWDFGFPTVISQDQTAFGAALAGSVDFGGTAAVTTMLPWGVSYCAWNDPAAANAWSARFTVLEPTELPKGTVATAWSSTTHQFGLALPGGANTVPVTLGLTSGAATLVYQVDKNAVTGVITVTPQDLTDPSIQPTVLGLLKATQAVRVYGIPQADGSIKAYVLLYYTGTTPAS